MADAYSRKLSGQFAHVNVPNPQKNLFKADIISKFTLSGFPATFLFVCIVCQVIQQPCLFLSRNVPRLTDNFARLLENCPDCFATLAGCPEILPGFPVTLPVFTEILQGYPVSLLVCLESLPG